MKTPFLVQRATIEKPLASPTTRLSNAVKFDYMGSSEFEFGALPQSLRRLQTSREHLKLMVEPRIKSGESSLRVLHDLTTAEYEEYVSYLVMIRNDKIRLKERAEFNESFGDRIYVPTTDFWWDVENDVMWSFHKPFMNRLTNILASSWKFMDDAANA